MEEEPNKPAQTTPLPTQIPDPNTPQNLPPQPSPSMEQPQPPQTTPPSQNPDPNTTQNPPNTNPPNPLPKLHCLLKTQFQTHQTQPKISLLLLIFLLCLKRTTRDLLTKMGIFRTPSTSRCELFLRTFVPISLRFSGHPSFTIARQLMKFENK